MWWNEPNSGMMSYGWGWMPFHGILSFFFLVIVIAGLVALVRWVFGTGAHRARGRSHSLAVLEERYAKGEMQRDEYLQKKA